MNNPLAHHFSRKDIHEKSTTGHIDEITREFKAGFEFLQKYPRSVSIYGSSRSKSDTHEWQQAESLAARIVKDLNYAVVTGGGPGIMEAASKGAAEAGGKAVGLGINLPNEHVTNPFTTDRIEFRYFFVRKAMLAFAAEAYIFFPGGFGTMDEFFSTITLIQTRKIPSVPVILFGAEYWKPLVKFFEKEMLEGHATISDYDLNIFEVTDDPDRAIEIIRTAPVSDWWRNLN